MQPLEIKSPELQDIFKTKFDSDSQKFMESIVSFIQDNKKVIDSYFSDKDKPTFEYQKLDPMKHYYKISTDEIAEDAPMSNPFEEVEDSVEFAKKLRESSYR